MISLDQSVCLNDTVICTATLTTLLKASLQATKLLMCLKIRHVFKFGCNETGAILKKAVLQLVFVREGKQQFTFTNPVNT